MAVVVCPSCATKLNVPEAAAGKRVKCPKCQTAIPVPAEFEEIEPDDDRPRKTKRRTEDDEPRQSSRRRSEEDNEEDRPVRGKSRRAAEEEGDEEDDRKPKKKKAAKKSNLPIILVGVAVGLFVMCGGLLAVGYWLSTPAPSPQLGTRGPQNPGNSGGPIDLTPGVTLEPGWVVFEDPRNEIRLHFPEKQPTKKDDPAARMNAGGGQDSETWLLEHKGKVFSLVRSTLPTGEVVSGREGAALDTAAKGMLTAFPGASEVRSGSGTEVGRPFRTSTIDIPSLKKRVFVRMTIHKNRLFIAMITGPNTMAIQPVEPDIAPFFNSFWAK